MSALSNLLAIINVLRQDAEQDDIAIPVAFQEGYDQACQDITEHLTRIQQTLGDPPTFTLTREPTLAADGTLQRLVLILDRTTAADAVPAPPDPDPLGRSR